MIIAHVEYMAIGSPHYFLQELYLRSHVRTFCLFACVLCTFEQEERFLFKYARQPWNIPACILCQNRISKAVACMSSPPSRTAAEGRLYPMRSRYASG